MEEVNSVCIYFTCNQKWIFVIIWSEAFFNRFSQLPVNTSSIWDLCNHVSDVLSQSQFAHKSVIRIKFLTQLTRISTNEKLIEQSWPFREEKQLCGSARRTD